MELEREFETRKAEHKYCILKTMITNYYRDLKDTGVNVPDLFKYDTPETLAKREIKRLLLKNDNGKEFNRLYELAWDSLKEYVV